MRWLALLPILALGSSASAEVRFNRDVRPILAESCFTCHGPDANQRKAKLRFDLDPGNGGLPSIVPGKPSESEFYRRITSDDPTSVMPPAKHGRPLSANQIRILQQWITEGAKWEEHWAFIPPQRPPLPVVKDKAWPRNPIDAFILARLERGGHTPNIAASRATLLRRLSFDLTGLPPTPAEVKAFEDDRAPNATEKVIDRLLASPRYGERMAWPWLEAARYADTNGYQTDAERDMWRWRDWVIDAYNRNMPFDQFTIEQLAGDLLPKPTLDQRIATGFNRNHRGNSEGGIVPEEYAVEYVVDRVETTSTVWLGLTMGCVRCHDHKYDPLTMRDFYGLFALFNNVPEKGRAVKFGNSPPMLKAPTREQTATLEHLQREQRLAELALANLEPAATKRFAAWQTTMPTPADATITDDLATHVPFDHLQEQWDAGNGRYTFGKHDVAGDFDGKRFVNLGDVGNFDFDNRFSVTAWFRPRSKDGPILTRAVDEPQGEGYGITLVDGKIHVYLNKRWLDDSLRIEAETPIKTHEWQHIAVTYDASMAATGVKVYVNGVAVRTKILADELNQRFATKEPCRLGAGYGQRFDGLLDEVRLYARTLTPNQVAIVSVPETIATILKKPTDQRTASQVLKLRWYYNREEAPADERAQHRRLAANQAALERLEATIPTVMVMEDMPTPRPTHILRRGEYDKKGDVVPAALPKVLKPPTAINRLDLAKWIVDPNNPLTARVAVNRLWQLHFGKGLVPTTDDFGTQGEYPTDPELLDWLATEFIRMGWDVKAMQKLMLSSAAYAMTSTGNSQSRHYQALGIGARLRLSPEMIRDQALAMAGLLVEKQGGPSVRPYQPAGLWKELSGAADYVQDHGEGLYRRSLYTYWKRTSPPPNLANFDAPARETCWVKQTRTNTPIQALTLLNDVVFVEAARKLAERVYTSEREPKQRLRMLVQFVLCRDPSLSEGAIIEEHYRVQEAAYRAKPDSAKALLKVGESPTIHAPASELAALTSTARLLMNLDEFVMRD